MIVLFEEAKPSPSFESILHGDVEELGGRLSDAQRKKVKEALNQRKYVETLENRIKDMQSEKKDFLNKIAEQERITNLYFRKMKLAEQSRELALNFQNNFQRATHRATLMQKNAQKWKGLFLKERSHHEGVVRNLEKYTEKNFVGNQLKAEVLKIWKAWTDVELIRKTLDDAQSRLLAEREHWLQVVSAIREHLQGEKDYSEYLVRR